MCSPAACSLYSFTGILFLLFVYTLLSTQSFFIRGIDDVNDAKKSALGGMLLFVASFLASLGWLLLKNRRGANSSRGSGHYELIDGASEMS